MDHDAKPLASIVHLNVASHIDIDLDDDKDGYG
jgi:hypothetical protein